AIDNIHHHNLLRSKNKTQKSIDHKKFLNRMKQTIKKLLEDETVQSNKIIGIGVAMHGVMNIEEGISYYSSNSGLENVPVKYELEKEFGYEVLLENNSRALALGEFWFGGFEHVDCFCGINVGRGVGS